MEKKKILAGLAAALMLSGFLGGAPAEWEEQVKGGKVVRRTWKDETGTTALAPEGYAVVTRSISGTSVTEKFFDAEDRPIRTPGGYYGQILTYGNRHRLEEIVYLDEDGDRMECAAGYARMKTVYTSSGAVKTTTYYDLAGEQVTVPALGYAQVKNEYRGTTLTSTTYLDEHKKPVDTPLGYAVLIQSVNKSNRVTGIRFEHADGSPASCAEGWATMKRELDKKNREVSLKYYDLAGKMTDRGLGYAYETKKWESDLVCVIRRYDLQDQPVSLGDGIDALRREMNKAGRVIRETFLDTGDAAREDSTGVASRVYGYDSEGRLVKVSFEGARGDATECASGYAGYEDTLDGDGFVKSRTFFSRGGKAVNTSAGYSEIRYVYDGNHQVIRTEYYDTDGNLLRQE